MYTGVFFRLFVCAVFCVRYLKFLHNVINSLYNNHGSYYICFFANDKGIRNPHIKFVSVTCVYDSMMFKC